MRLFNVFLLCSAIVLVCVGPAAAVPAGPNGETCSSSATGVKRTINGKDYTCDKCVFTKCDTAGNEIKNCRTVTHYSNCVAALGKPPLSGIIKTPSGVLKKAQ